jgi:hypothetical protein
MTVELMTLIALWCSSPEPQRYESNAQVNACRAEIMKCFREQDVPVNKCFEQQRLPERP